MITALVITPTKRDYDHLIMQIAQTSPKPRAQLREEIKWATKESDLRGIRNVPVWPYANWYQDDTCRDLVVFCEEHDIEIGKLPITEYAVKD